jgi:hypothetical protein
MNQQLRLLGLEHFDAFIWLDTTIFGPDFGNHSTLAYRSGVQQSIGLGSLTCISGHDYFFLGSGTRCRLDDGLALHTMDTIARTVLLSCLNFLLLYWDGLPQDILGLDPVQHLYTCERGVA